MRFAFPLYAVGFGLTIGALTGLVVEGWTAVWVMIVGLVIFCVGIVVEERLEHRPPVPPL